jgi:hypothetical protein
MYAEYVVMSHYGTEVTTKCVYYITNERLLIQCSLLLSALYMFRAGFPPIISLS